MHDVVPPWALEQSKQHENLQKKMYPFALKWANFLSKKEWRRIQKDNGFPIVRRGQMSILGYVVHVLVIYNFHSVEPNGSLKAIKQV